MNRAICKFSVALIVTSIVASIIIPIVYHARGYFAVGGEWLAFGIVFGIVCWLY